MKLPSIVKLPKHRVFEMPARYYDADKEAIKERVALAKSKHEATLSFKEKNIKFERRTTQKRFRLNLQMYLILFMLFNLFLLYEVDNMSNKTWGIILILQVLAIYAKVKFDQKREQNA